MTLSNLIIQLKGGSGSGNHGHSGIPGKVGGSAAKGITSTHVAKLVSAISKSERGKISAGYLGRANAQELVNAGYIENVGGPYHKLTSSGADLVSGKLQVEQIVKPVRVKKAPVEFDPTSVKPGDNLSYNNAIEYMKTLPGYTPKVDIVKMTDSRSIRTPGATASARYYEGSIELPNKVKARTVAHELGHYIYDYGIKSDIRFNVHNEYKKAKAAGNEGGPLRPYAMRYPHEFFADMYSGYLHGDETTKSNLTNSYPYTAEVVRGIVGD